MAVGVVDFLEPVEVDDHDGTGVAEAAEARLFDLHVTVPPATVEQAGQRIGLGGHLGALDETCLPGSFEVGVEDGRQEHAEDVEQGPMLEELVGSRSGVEAALFRTVRPWRG